MDGSHPRTWWISCKVFRIGAHAWICTPEEKGKLWKKHRKVRCSSSKCKKFVLLSDHFCAHCGEANEKFDPVEEATNKEGQRTGWLGKRPGEFDPKSLAAEFEESFVEETKVIVGDLLADLNTRSGKGKVVADIGKVVSHKDLADIATAALKDPADIAKAAHKEPEAEVDPMWDLCDWAQVKACIKAIVEKDENGFRRAEVPYNGQVARIKVKKSSKEEMCEVIRKLLPNKDGNRKERSDWLRHHWAHMKNSWALLLQQEDVARTQEWLADTTTVSEMKAMQFNQQKDIVLHLALQVKLQFFVEGSETNCREMVALRHSRYKDLKEKVKTLLNLEGYDISFFMCGECRDECKILSDPSRPSGAPSGAP